MQSRGILVSDKWKSYALCETDDPRSNLRPGFHTSGKSQTIGDFGVPRWSGMSRVCLRFRVFISRQNLGRLENCKIPDRLGLSRHIVEKPGKKFETSVFKPLCCGQFTLSIQLTKPNFRVSPAYRAQRIQNWLQFLLFSPRESILSEQNYDRDRTSIRPSCYASREPKSDSVRLGRNEGDELRTRRDLAIRLSALRLLASPDA